MMIFIKPSGLVDWPCLVLEYDDIHQTFWVSRLALCLALEYDDIHQKESMMIFIKPSGLVDWPCLALEYDDIHQTFWVSHQGEALRLMHLMIFIILICWFKCLHFMVLTVATRLVVVGHPSSYCACSGLLNFSCSSCVGTPATAQLDNCGLFKQCL